jgi:hypothetical protein
MDPERNSEFELLLDVLNIDLGYLLLPEGRNRSVSRKNHIRRLEESWKLQHPDRKQPMFLHIIGVLMLHAACESIDQSIDHIKADFLGAAHWIRRAAKMGVSESEFVFGELFRHGLFCDVHMRFARKYTRRASAQGHVKAIASMKELRSCHLCGVDDAPLMCARCHQARYCDAACSGIHWYEGGGVGNPAMRGAGEFAFSPHKTTCLRTHRTRRQDYKAAKKMG